MQYYPHSWSAHPVLRLFLPFAVGILCAFQFSYFSWSLTFIWCAVLAVLSLVVQRKHSISSKFWLGIFLQLFILFTGYTWSSYRTHNAAITTYITPDTLNNALLYRGTISAPPVQKNWHRLTVSLDQYFVADEWRSVKAKVSVYLEPNAEVPQFGDLIAFQAKFTALPPPTNPHAFDFARFQKHHGISYQAFVSAEHWHVAENTAWSVQNSLITYRNHLKSRLQKYLPDPRTLGIASALLLGDRGVVDPEIKAAYTNTGAVHILAVSGLHVGFIALIFWWLGGFIPGKYGQIMIAVLGVWSFALLTGASPSVLRASTMYTLFILAQLRRRKTVPFNILAAAAFLILIIDPNQLFLLGFQLSFAAVAGILAFQPLIEKSWQPKNVILQKAWVLFTVSCAAQLGTLPISIFYFHQFPIFFWLSSLIAVPAAGLILLLGIGVLVASFLLDPIAALLGWCLHWVISILNAFILFLETFTFGLIEDIWWSPLQVAVLVFVLIITYLGRTKKQRQFYIYALAGMVVFSSCQLWNTWQTVHQQETVFYSTRSGLIFDDVRGRTLRTYEHDIDEQNVHFAASSQRSKWQLKTIETLGTISGRRMIIDAPIQPIELDEKIDVQELIITEDGGSPATVHQLFDAEYVILSENIDYKNRRQWLDWSSRQTGVIVHDCKVDGAFKKSR